MSRQTWNETISSAALCLINYSCVWKTQIKNTTSRSHISIGRHIDKILLIYITYEMPWFIVIGVIKKGIDWKLLLLHHSTVDSQHFLKPILFFLFTRRKPFTANNELFKIRMSGYLSAAIYLLRRRMTRNPQ